MHHLRQSQRRWASGDWPSLPLEMACLGSRGRPQCCEEAAGRRQRLRMPDSNVSTWSDVETTTGKEKLWVCRGKRALHTSRNQL